MIPQRTTPHVATVSDKYISITTINHVTDPDDCQFINETFQLLGEGQIPLKTQEFQIFTNSHLEH